VSDNLQLGEPKPCLSIPLLGDFDNWVIIPSPNPIK
jgi:hypothetical protein